MFNVLTTPRLLGHVLGAEHFDLLRRLHTDRRVMRTLSVQGTPHSPERSREILLRVEQCWRTHGYGLWAFFDRPSAEASSNRASPAAFVGYAGLLAINNRVELAYAVLSDRWGAGFAAEMGGAALDVAFHQFGLTEVVAFALPTNYASRRVLHKLGFDGIDDVVHAGLPHLLYRRASEPMRVTLPQLDAVQPR